MTQNELLQIAEDKLKLHIKPIYQLKDSVFVVSDQYPGIWIEHVYDSIMYGYLYNDYTLAKNTILTFIKYQTEEGLYPYSIKDKDGPGYYQIQECVSFLSLAYKVFEKTNDIDFLKTVYDSGKRYISWLMKYRMTRNLGLVEMFVGYDTGHDNSGRLDGMTYPQNYKNDGIKQNASILPNCNRAPIIAVDMNSNYYGNLVALSKIAHILDKKDEYKYYTELSQNVKKSLFKYCYNENDGLFYDLDKNNTFHKVKSSTIFHLFQEHVFDNNKDISFISTIYNDYMVNKNEFYTPFPFPSVAISDETFKTHKKPNSWGYYSQALTALRCSLWMDDYGYQNEYNYILSKWIEGIEKNYDSNPFSQELDPITGEASSSSLWYSTSLLLYIYAVNRLKK